MTDPLYARLGTGDWLVVEELFALDEYAPLIRRQLRDIRTVVDLGSNVGYSLRLWESQFPSALLIAVEPDAENAKMCRRNAARSNEHGRLCLVQACVAGHSREVCLDRSGGAWGYAMREVDATPSGSLSDTDVVPAMTLLQILGRAGLDPSVPIDLLKCDIEGSEKEVFANCASWIGRVRNMVVEVHGAYTADQFLDDLRRAGGRFELYGTITDPSHAVLFLAASVA